MRALPAVFLCLMFTSASADEFPPTPGERIDLGGYKVHLHCQGEGHPIVIIDVGLGDDSTDWQQIHQNSAENTRTCVFDRPGYGWSDFGPSPRSSVQIAKEINLLLEKSTLEPPYILAGHSFGGFNIRVYAANHPDNVAGMVLIDASHEEQYDRLNIKLPNRDGRRGNFMFLPKTSAADQADKPKVLRERAYHAARAEVAAMNQSAIQVARNGAIPDVPLVVVTRGLPEWYGDLTQEQREKDWVNLQHELYKLAPNSTHMFAHKSGHNIPLEQPEIIVDAIADVIEQTRD